MVYNGCSGSEIRRGPRPWALGTKSLPTPFSLACRPPGSCQSLFGSMQGPDCGLPEPAALKNFLALPFPPPLLGLNCIFSVATYTVWGSRFGHGSGSDSLGPHISWTGVWLFHFLSCVCVCATLFTKGIRFYARFFVSFFFTQGASAEHCDAGQRS